jgi:hypothetical protein
MGLKKEDEIVANSLKAIRDSIQFLGPLLENIEYCNKTFELLMPFMNNEVHREGVYEIMYDFCKYCYITANNYLPLITKFTIAHMQLRNEVSLSALHLWETIGTEYLERAQDINDRVNEQHGQQVPNLVMNA